MKSTRAATPRGRPATITRERITDAGIQMTVPKITFVGIATLLGVSQVALYKHVPNLEALRLQVAEDIFERWEIPRGSPEDMPLAQYLLVFSTALREQVGRHPGLAQFLVLRGGVKSGTMLAKIRKHHRETAKAYGIAESDAAWLLSTVAFHCVALADTVYSSPLSAHAADSGRTPAQAAREEAALEQGFALGMRALVIGLLALRDEPGDLPAVPRRRQPRG